MSQLNKTTIYCRKKENKTKGIFYVPIHKSEITEYKNQTHAHTIIIIYKCYRVYLR